MNRDPKHGDSVVWSFRSLWVGSFFVDVHVGLRLESRLGLGAVDVDAGIVLSYVTNRGGNVDSEGIKVPGHVLSGYGVRSAIALRPSEVGARY